MSDQRVLKNLDRPTLIADAPGCHDCPSWQRAGGNGSACGVCTLAGGPRQGWLTGYTSICPRHPRHPDPAVRELLAP